jgi:hypothetical protein
MELKELIRADMTAFLAAEKTSECKTDIADIRADYRLADYAHRAMCEKLAIARSKGRGGWWNPEECSIDYLRELLRKHVEKGDMRDVMNLAAMVYVRECIGA